MATNNKRKADNIETQPEELEPVIESTLADVFTDDPNRNNCFDIIRQVFRMFGTIKHRTNEKDRYILNTSDFYLLSFPVINSKMIKIQELESLIMRDPHAIRNIYVHWPKKNDPYPTFSMDIEVFNKDHKPISVPIYIQTKYRNNKCKDRLLALQKTAEFPVSWSQDIGVIAEISDAVYNMEEFIPQLTSTIKLSKATNTYKLIFDGMERVSFDFLEYLWITFTPRITDIRFVASGTTTRTMIIDISGTGNTTIRLPLTCRQISSSSSSNTKNKKKGEREEPEQKGTFSIFKKIKIFQ